MPTTGSASRFHTGSATSRSWGGCFTKVPISATNSYCAKGSTSSRRINVSYEAVEGLASYDIGEEFRVYGGVSYLFDQDPSDLKPWGTQAGLEYESSETFANGQLRPIAAADLKFREESDWEMDLSLRAGVQLESTFLGPRRIRLLAEYYNGSNPNGQFYSRDLEYIGFGINVQLD